VGVVRLSTREHSGIEGTGAKLYGGRWNSPGRPVVFTASCGALAVLGTIVNSEKAFVNMCLVRIEVPDTLPIEEIDSLPADPDVFRQLGDEWLQHNGTPVLRVPSV
jgi:RES domain-containing protein